MKKLFYLSMIALISCACQHNTKDGFNYKADRFADMEILHYQVPGFEDLSLRQKELIYDLSQAALYGRDILYDQNCRYNLLVRHTLEAIYQYSTIEKSGDDWDAFVVYLKRVWVSNGIHHHYATDKFTPGFSAEFFTKALAATPQEQLDLPKDELLVCL